MKWKKYFIININIDLITSIYARKLQVRYNIPPSRHFFHGCGDFGKYPELAGAMFNASPLLPTSLAAVDRTSKLMIVSHGSEFGLCSMDMATLVSKLVNSGLKEVGLISFKACLTGKGRFLDILSKDIAMRGIDHGWLIGYRETAMLTFSYFGSPWHTCINSDEDIDLHYYHGYKSADNDRIRLVKGNIDVVLPGTRRFSTTSPQLCNLRRRLT
ncbi:MULTISPECIES: hypothetical protein [unclassified Chelatococcus]|uniref:hypothetical protein n=1 Tax=unclassified Chelatococcus TaxID=2638111 RepID=UPI001BCC693A|nr:MULTISPECIES: hypothetical protein [unclassified Chelatococcus]MBS7697753.1 hypothetical protein [Chelatococcus sp. YT9]MBX3558390.1 hypothetical protein [Chelatococcus sp.]